MLYLCAFLVLVFMVILGVGALIALGDLRWVDVKYNYRDDCHTASGERSPPDKIKYFIIYDCFIYLNWRCDSDHHHSHSVPYTFSLSGHQLFEDERVNFSYSWGNGSHFVNKLKTCWFFGRTLTHECKLQGGLRFDPISRVSGLRGWTWTEP